MRRKIGMMLLAGMILVGTAGCFMNKEEDREQLLTYMSEKYHEEFVSREPYTGQFGVKYTAILAESCRYPGKKVLARVSWIKGEKCFEDNYIAYLLQEGIENELEMIARESFGNCEVIYQIPMFVFPEDFGADMTVSEFLSESEANVEVLLIPDEQQEDKFICEEKLDAFRKRVLQKGYCIRGTVKCGEEELIFSMDETGEFSYMRWLSKKEDAR